MNILLVGNGAREHALAWKLSQSPIVQTIHVIEPNPGIQKVLKVQTMLPASDWKQMALQSRALGIDLLVVGPEQPLSEGITDIFLDQKIPVYGPSRSAAQIESSKIFCKTILETINIPTARSAVCNSANEAIEALLKFQLPVVLKVDGLASGKGVFILHNIPDAQKAIHEVMVQGRFGKAGSRLLIEEFLTGPELSYMVFASGTEFVTIESSQDHKRLLDGNKGPNTGGMGAYSPSPFVSLELKNKIESTIIQPLLQHMSKSGMPFVGTLYAGLILTSEGPKVLEFNARFGDPETQVLVPRLKSDLAEIMWSCANHKKPAAVVWDTKPSVGIVLASGNYPHSASLASPILGLDKVESSEAFVFQGGTQKGAQGQVLATGGRIITVVALGDNFPQARTRAYLAAKKLHFEGMQFRSDIAEALI